MRFHKIREVVLCTLLGAAFVFALVVGVPLAERTFGGSSAAAVSIAPAHQKNQ